MDHSLTNCRRCRNAFKCTRYATCPRAAQARQIIFGNRAELLFLTEPVAFYQVDRTTNPKTVIADFKKIASSAIYSIEQSKRGGLHLNFIASQTAPLGELSNFSSAIESREEARRVGAYISKPDQLPNPRRLKELTNLTQISNSWGNIRKFEQICQSPEMVRRAPHIAAQSAIIALSNSLGICRSHFDKEEKNPLVRHLRELLLHAWHHMKTNNTDKFFIESRREIITLAQTEMMLKKIGLKKEL